MQHPEVSCVVRCIYMSLGAKELTNILLYQTEIESPLHAFMINVLI